MPLDSGETLGCLYLILGVNRELLGIIILLESMSNHER